MSHARGHFARAAVLALLPLAFLLAMQIAPAVRLMALGLGDSAQGGVDLLAPVQDAYLRTRLVWSLLQAGVTCLLAFALGLPIAWVLARLEFAGRIWVLRALMLPFVVPTLVAALGVLALFGSEWQGTPWLLLYGNLFFNLCVVVRAATEALEQVSASQVAAARSLGASPWRAFWRVEWPSIAPWTLSALCLVFLYCFSGFGLALLLGGAQYATIEVEIYTLVAHELQLAQASVLALWMVALTGLVAFVYAAIERRLASAARPDRIARHAPRGLLQWSALVAALVLLALVCGAPLLAIAWRALQAGASAWSVLLEDETRDALWNTVCFSVLSVLLATALGLAHALAAQRFLLLRTLVFLPLVVSPILVGFGLLLLYPQHSGSFWILVCAYALLAYPWVARSVAARLDSLPTSYLEAARTLGATPSRLFCRVTLPLIAGALRRGVAFAAATAVGEFAVTLFLSRPEWATLTTLIYERLGRPGAANLDAALVLACLLMALAMLAFVLIEWESDGADNQTGAPERRSHA